MKDADLPCDLALQKAQDGSTDEYAALRLLECFRSGKIALKRLIDLALSKDQASAELGTWIASELPSHTRTLLPQLLPCLTHPSHRVRLSMLDVLAHRAAIETDISIDETILAHVLDEHVAVRCKSVELMARWSNERLKRVIRAAPSPAPAGHASGAIRQRPSMHAFADHELHAVEQLVAAVKARNDFEEGAMRVTQSRSAAIAATARALLSEVDEAKD